MKNKIGKTVAWFSGFLASAFCLLTSSWCWAQTVDLSAAPELPVEHYAWPPGLGLYDPANHDFLVQQTRILGSISVTVQWATQKEVGAAVVIAREAAVCRSAPVKLGLEFSGWYDKACNGPTAGYCKGDSPLRTDRDAVYTAWLIGRLTSIQAWLAEANTCQCCRVEIGCLYFDNEVCGLKDCKAPGEAAALMAKHELLRRTVRGVLGDDIHVTFYARGGVDAPDSWNSTTNSFNQNWSRNRYFDGTEDGQLWRQPAPVLYCTNDLLEMSMILDFARTCPGAAEFGLAPWASITGYHINQSIPPAKPLASHFRKHGVTGEQATALGNYLQAQSDIKLVILYPALADPLTPRTEAERNLFNYATAYSDSAGI